MYKSRSSRAFPILIACDQTITKMSFLNPSIVIISGPGLLKFVWVCCIIFHFTMRCDGFLASSYCCLRKRCDIEGKIPLMLQHTNVTIERATNE